MAQWPDENTGEKMSMADYHRYLKNGQVPVFSGKIDGFFDFKQEFIAAYHKPKMNTVWKFQALRKLTADNAPQVARRLVLDRLLESRDPELRLTIAELAAESGDELRRSDPERAMALYLDSARVCYRPALV